MTGRDVAGVLLLSLVIGCRKTPEARPSPLAALPTCKAVAIESQPGWQVVTSADDDVTVAAPRGFGPFDRGVEYMHGGSAWKSGEAVIELSYGMWGVDSFPNSETACRTTVDGVDTYYLERQSAEGVVLLAWYRSSTVPSKNGQPHEPVLSAASPRTDDLAMLRTIIFSVKVSRS